MRISDWSQTCALPIYGRHRAAVGGEIFGCDLHAADILDGRRHPALRGMVGLHIAGDTLAQMGGDPDHAGMLARAVVMQRRRRHLVAGELQRGFLVIGAMGVRSEEHTYDIKSLMRSSYAGFSSDNNTNQ